MVKITSDIAHAYENGISENAYNSYNKGKYGFGYKLSDYIYISNIFLKKNYNKKVEIKCKVCERKQILWTSNISSGDWSVCGHDNI